jgi:hypothetical protein
MHQRIVIEQNRKTRQLITVGQSSIDQKISGLFKGGHLGQLFNRDTAISQNPLFPVHKRY